MHPWHDLPLPASLDDGFPVVIEIPQGAKTKYEVDRATGLLRVDRVLSVALRFPANYGFVPRTLGDDGDPVDVLVLGQEPIQPLAFARARAIGGFRMRDEEGIDDKVLCVHLGDPAYRDYRAVGELPRHVLDELRCFFEDYKKLDRLPTEIGRTLAPAEALALVREGAARYRRRFGRQPAIRRTASRSSGSRRAAKPKRARAIGRSS